MGIEKKAADNIRRLVVSTVQNAKSGHPGGSLGAADFMHILFSEFLEYNPDDPAWDLRDRFFMDPGHMSSLLYSTLALAGFYSMDDLKKFRQWGSTTPGHPELDLAHCIENTSGPLGLGHAFGVGSAIAQEFLETRFGGWTNHHTFVLISDGGIQEEISQGVGRLAGHLELGNLIMFYDSNEVQLSSRIDETSSEDIVGKYTSWNWQVLTVDAYNHADIRLALSAAISNRLQPTLIVGHTVIAKGAVDDRGRSLEGEVSTHGSPLGEEATKNTIKRLGGNPEDPFVIDPDVKAFYNKRREHLRKLVKMREEQRTNWKKANKELAKTYEEYIKGLPPKIEYENIKQKENSSTRVASGAILSHFADNVKNMVVSSADLACSDKTEEFLKKTKVMMHGNFQGAFLQAGVSELTMSALLTGISLHGGVIAAGGTFFVFSDYMKPAIRLASMMGVPVKFIWSHDSFRVGEDGPTHQPVEHEAQVRLLEKIKDADGKPVFIALRPADSAETTVAWQIAMENTKTPTALILTRQNVEDLPGLNGKTRYETALEAKKGAYIVSENGKDPELILIASGSDVVLCEQVANKLRNHKSFNIRVVSVPSEGLFRAQSKGYQESILPVNKAVFGVSSGLPDSLKDLVGPFGKVYGLERFGASAPYKILEEKFGFTVQNIEKQVLGFMEQWKENVNHTMKNFGLWK